MCAGVVHECVLFLWGQCLMFGDSSEAEHIIILKLSFPLLLFGVFLVVAGDLWFCWDNNEIVCTIVTSAGRIF